MTELLIYGVDGFNHDVVQMLGEERMPTIHGLQNQEDTEYGEFKSYIVDGYNEPHTGPCLTPDVRAYTREGFKSYDDIDVGDEVLSISEDEVVEWKKVERVVVREHDDKIYDLDHSKISASVTPDHKLAVLNEAGVERIKAEEAPSKFYVPTSGSQKEVESTVSEEIGDKTYSGRNFAELLGWFIADGNISGNEVRISKTIEEDRKKIKALFESYGFDYYGSGTNVSIYSPELSDWLEEEVGRYSTERSIPRWILSDAPTSFLEKLFTTLMNADGDRNTNLRYHTSSEELAETFSELSIRLGYAPSITNRGGGVQEIKGEEYDVEDRYRVNLGERNRNTQIRKHRHWSERQYKGKVWDLTVEDNHTFLAERDGRMHFTGNCWTSMYTGLTPEEHGLSEGGWEEGDSIFHNIYTVWDKLSDEGKELGLFGMPMTYKAKELNGWMVSGFVHTTLKSLYDNALYPTDILDNDFIENSAAYVAKVKHEQGIHPNMPEDARDVFETFSEAENNRLSAFESIVEDRGAPEIAAYGTTFADKMGHADAINPANELTRETYKQVDDMLAKLIEILDPEEVMIVSDHGFSGWSHDLYGYYLNTAGFEIDGLMNFTPELLEHYSIDYDSTEYGPGSTDESDIGLSDEEKEDVRGQLADLGYIDEEDV